jgi:hypothetical protein
MTGSSSSAHRHAAGLGLAAAYLLVSAATVSSAQTRVEPAEFRCPSVLGVGVDTGQIYCDVLIGAEVADGIIVVIPAHEGPAVVTFTLHARHTYSETEVARGQGYARYLVSTVVATTEVVLSRPMVLAEFRSEADLTDRVGGGAGPGGVKAVAPVAGEGIRITVPADVTEISIVGIELDVLRREGREVFSSPGRPIAVMSDVQVEYRAK